MSTALLEVHQLSKHYVSGTTERCIFRDLNLQVERGETVAILGASGCGKSTLLRVLVGLDNAYGGQLLIAGQPQSGVSEACAIVFQEHRLFPWLSALENIELGLANSAFTAPERKQRALQWLDRVGLAAFSASYPHQLSGGMSQRVAIARALISEPRLLLLDEPFGALDALTRTRLQDTLLSIAGDSGLTTLLVTHDVEEALYLADRIVVMAANPGRIEHIHPVGLSHPRQRSSQAFIGQREGLLARLKGAA